MNKWKFTLSRRELLQGLGSVFLATQAHGASRFLASTQNFQSRYKNEYPNIPENHIELPKNGKKVLIIGAGLSGLISACELLDRGFDVTILEKSPRAGGKLISWRDKNFGKPSQEPSWNGHPLEHGTHAVCWFYRNFREFLYRKNLRIRKKITNSPYGLLQLVYTDGTLDDRHVSNLPPPFHALEIMKDLKKINKTNKNISYDLQQFLRFISFDSENASEVKYLDSISTKNWAEKIGFSNAFVSAFIDPILEMSNFKTGDTSSALAWHRFIDSTLGQRADLANFQFFQDSTEDTVIQPLVQYIYSKGGKFYFNTEVIQFFEKNKHITGVKTGSLNGKVYICPICGEMHFYNPKKCQRCGYMGNDFVNPVVPEEEFSSDYYLFAVDPLNAKRILIQEPFTQFDEFARIRELPVGRVTTAFIWYSGNTWYKHFEERESIFFTGFPYLKTTMNLTYLKPNSYKNFNADILEIQISPGEITNALTDHEVASAVDKDLRSIMPELPPFLDFRVHRIDNFSSVTVGSEKTRPPIFNSLDNFFILGDYVSLKHNAIFMEKVAVVAKTVVNHILEREHLNEAKIKILSSETPNLMVKTIRKVLHVL